MAEKKINMHFYVTQEEYDLIMQNMALVGTVNLSAYLRKMAIDGRIIKLDMPQIKELLSLLRRANANINQIAKQTNASGRVYDTDLQEIRQYQKEIYRETNTLLMHLTDLQ